MSYSTRKEYIEKKYEYVDDAAKAPTSKKGGKKRYPARHKHEYVNVTIHYHVPHNSLLMNARDGEATYACSVCRVCGKVTSCQSVEGFEKVANYGWFAGLNVKDTQYSKYMEYYLTHFPHIHIPDFDPFKTKFVDVSSLS